MKKLFLFMAIAFASVYAASAQYTDLYAFEKGNSLVGVNIGVKTGANSATAVSAFYEYGLARLFADECTLGGGIFGGYYKNKYGKNKEDSQKIYILGVRLNVHYQFVERLDTYAGFDPNFNIETWSDAKDEANFKCYFHVGGRYYLTNWLGVFAEASTGYNNFSGGVSVKF